MGEPLRKCIVLKVFLITLLFNLQQSLSPKHVDIPTLVNLCFQQFFYLHVEMQNAVQAAK